tara:strand:+ start:53900 stop:54895 length:996 start_codon:yes stop_codon:yes gene_type:complete
MKHISILALPQALASSMAIPLEMLSAADTIHSLQQHQRSRTLQLQTVGETPDPITVTGGMTLVPSATLQAVGHTDMVFIPALWGNPRAVLASQRTTLQWLQRQYSQGAIFCSVGSGSYLLAEAGLLNGKPATTHWRYFDDFAKRYPDVKLQRKRFITHGDRLYCTGSVNAVRDIMLHFVELLFNSAVADEVARHFTHELKRSYESLLLGTEQHNSHHDELIIKVQEWMQKHYQRSIRMADLAASYGLNMRTFNRRFRLAANKTPTEYLQEVRINQARELLKHSNLSITEIGFAVGYQDVSYFTGLFRRLHDVTPNAYRRLVRTKVFNVNRA